MPSLHSTLSAAVTVGTESLLMCETLAIEAIGLCCKTGKYPATTWKRCPVARVPKVPDPLNPEEQYQSPEADWAAVDREQKHGILHLQPWKW